MFCISLFFQTVTSAFPDVIFFLLSPFLKGSFSSPWSEMSEICAFLDSRSSLSSSKNYWHYQRIVEPSLLRRLFVEDQFIVFLNSFWIIVVGKYRLLWRDISRSAKLAFSRIVGDCTIAFLDQFPWRGFLYASLKGGGFPCLRTRLSSAIKSSSREYSIYPTHSHWHLLILRLGTQDQSSYKWQKKTHTYINSRRHLTQHSLVSSRIKNFCAFDVHVPAFLASI